jgi:hypothetical protein
MWEISCRSVHRIGPRPRVFRSIGRILYRTVLRLALAIAVVLGTCPSELGSSLRILGSPDSERKASISNRLTQEAETVARGIPPSRNFLDSRFVYSHQIRTWDSGLPP